MRLFFITPLVIILLVIFVMLANLFKEKQTGKSALIGKKVEKFQLPVLFNESNSLSSNELKSEYLLVNIFASWCIPCKIEHGFLMELKSKYNIKIYGINWKDKPENVREWFKKKGNPFYKIGRDKNGEAVVKFGATGAPETFLISPEGKILFNYPGVLDKKIFDELFRPMMK